MASCRQLESLVQAYVDGELTVTEHEVLDAHLAECSACARALDQQRATSEQMADLFSDHRLRHDLTPAVMAHLPEADRSRGVRALNERVQTRGRKAFFLTTLPAIAAAVIVVLGLALVFFWPENALNSVTNIGMITAADGVAFHTVPGDTQRHAVTNMQLIRRDDRFETSEGATLALSLGGPSHLKVAGNSRFKLFDSRRMTVERGLLWFNVGKERRTFRVLTPTGDITVWGTTFSVAVDQTGTLVTVEEGEVTVEYGHAFTVLRDGSQVHVRAGATELTARPVDAAGALAWAQEIVPSPRAELAFAETIKPRAGKVIAAEQYFVLDVRRDDVQTIHLKWLANEAVGARAGYDIYFYDDNMAPLLIKHINGSVFSNPSITSYELSVENDAVLSNANVLHLKVVPDRNQGDIETSFTQIYWVPSHD